LVAPHVSPVAKIALMSERTRRFSARLLMSDFKWRHFQGEVILQAVRWYGRYGVSYRDLEQMMGERGVPVDHSTIYCWVQRYAPEL
jgi:transposase-like protein